MKPRRVSPFRSAKGAAARLAGHRREILAALWLMLKGYRILGFRLRTPQAEIDLLAQKGPILAVVEVKSRTTLQEAIDCVTPAQRDRLRRAARALASHRASLRGLIVRLDLIAIGAGGRPRHIANAWLEAESG